MPWNKDGSYTIDDTELIPPDQRTPADWRRIQRNRSAKQRALDEKMTADFIAGRGVFAPKKKVKISKKGEK